jgi:hypothetical protein
MGFMDFFSGGIVESIGKVADDLITSDEERLEKENERLKTDLNYKVEMKKLDIEDKRLDNQLMVGQMEINKEEAKHPSIFVAGWRPAIGWIGAIALGYQFVLYPFLIWLWTFLQAIGTIPVEASYPPVLDVGALWTIVSGMLGIGVMRSVDKAKGKDTRAMKGAK